jgi:N-carbamoyl-L-amino-acid hydrolase
MMEAGLSYGLAEQLERHFAKLNTIGIEPDGAISRVAYSEEESTAIAYVRAEGESFGLIGHYDGVGNLILGTPGTTQKRLLVGSHLDSVPYAGNYDGSTGVVAALEALRDIVSRDIPLETGIDLVVWRGEEYTFNAVYMGSSAAFGMSEPHILHNLLDDRSLRDAILQQGFDPSFIDASRPTFTPEYIDNIAGYLELHIEQGVRLERERVDLGIVSSIAGDRRFLVVLEGRFDHSGATPMGVQYRSDVNLTMAHIQTRIDELASARRQQGQELVQTVGIVNADPEIDKKYPDVHGNSVTKVSGIGYFTLDIMGSDDALLDSYAAELHRLIWRTAKEMRTKAIIEQTNATAGVAALDAKMQQLLQRCADGAGVSTLTMPSGAGHDAVIVAQAMKPSGGSIPVGMLFVPCKNGVSHAKEEYVAPEQVARGTLVLRDALLGLATGGSR